MNPSKQPFSDSELNHRIHYLTDSKKKIEASLEERAILFDPDAAEKLFQDVGILFNGQLKKDFSQLIEFNQKITLERRTYLMGDLADIEEELNHLQAVRGS